MDTGYDDLVIGHGGEILLQLALVRSLSWGAVIDPRRDRHEPSLHGVHSLRLRDAPPDAVRAERVPRSSHRTPFKKGLRTISSALGHPGRIAAAHRKQLSSSYPRHVEESRVL